MASFRALPALFGFAASLTATGQSAKPSSAPLIMHMSVDAREAPQQILRARLQIPVSPGDETLVYPKWIPGEHGPTGPIASMTGLMIRAEGQQLPWRRDDVDMFAFHVHVPKGTFVLDVSLEFLATAGPGAFISGASVGNTFAVVNWNELLLYPEHRIADNIIVDTQLRLCDGWHYGTALETSSIRDGLIHFRSVSLTQLIDSPLIAGQHFREIPLSTNQTAAHFLDLVADNDTALAVGHQQIRAYGRLIEQAGYLFGSRHYDSYHFLVSLSDQLGNTGLEHHQSSDDRLPEKTFVDPVQAKLEAWLLPHEFIHSWNGKYRRPVGLLTQDYQTPMKGNLLWIYEGLTTYLGELLAERVGLWTAAEFRQELALKAADMEHRPGRTWRNLEDTTISAQILSGSYETYESWRRSVDYYPEGELIWLNIDGILRERSGGKRSLTDFCQDFFGGNKNTGPEVLPYTLDELVTSLNAIAPYDWTEYLNAVLTSNSPESPLEGLRRTGYQLVYRSEPSEMERFRENDAHHINARFSLGSSVREDGTVEDVIFGSPLYVAKVVPGSKIVTVDGQNFTIDALRKALVSAVRSAVPINLRVARGGMENDVHLSYHDGERYPDLQRLINTTDLLEEFLSLSS